MTDYEGGRGQPSPTGSTGGGEALKRYLRVLLEHWKLVVACVVIALLAAGAYVVTAPKRYRASAQMLISPIPTNSGYLSGLSLLHSSGIPVTDTLNGASLITTIPVAEAVIKQLQLNETPTTLLASVTATPVGQSSLVAVSATSTSPARAQHVANAFVTQVVATRTATLHQQLGTLIPALREELKTETPAQQTDSGLPAELAQLQQLAATNDPTITISSLAQLPTAPYTPKRKLALIAGFLVGLLIGIAAAFAIDALDPRLRRESQIPDVVGFRVLARIPNFKGARRGRLGKHPGPMLPGELPPSAREGYRVLRMVLDRGASGTASRCYLLTGSSPSEGKTTSAINLATSLAQTGARVLLLELDLRRPMMSRSLGIKPTRGTEHVISSRTRLEDALTLVRSGGADLEVLAVSSPNPQLADSLSYDIVAPLLAEARRLADYVVIDSPPLTSVIDALPVVNVVDAVVVVARLGITPLSRMTRLRDLLLAEGASVAGVVLIGESPRHMPAYYSATSGRADGYDASSEPTADVRLGSGATRGE
jgi:Mrp family chromosome partitioning ATPase/capsular polysaccharide biosynthesis protein